MSIELSLLITIISVSCAVFFGAKSARRNNEADIKKEATSMAIVVTKLENIETGITDIKGEINSIKNNVQRDHDRLIAVTELVDSVNTRVVELAKSVHELEQEINSVKQTVRGDK